MLNIPNCLTFLRITVVPLLVIVLLSREKTTDLWAALLFSFGSITDFLDGYYARKYDRVTTFGKFMDPIADKMLIISAFIMLVHLDRIPGWMVVIFVGREMAVTGLRVIVVGEGTLIPVSKLGKKKTVLQVSAIIPLILHYPYIGIDFHAVVIFFLWIALVFTIWYGLDYFITFFNSIRKGNK